MFRTAFIWLLILRSLEIFSQNSDSIVLVLKGHSEMVLLEKFSHDGSKILTLSMDGTVKVWDVQNGKLLFGIELTKKRENLSSQFSKIDKNINFANFSPDDKFIVTTGFDGTIRLFEVESGK